MLGWDSRLGNWWWLRMILTRVLNLILPGFSSRQSKLPLKLDHDDVYLRLVLRIWDVIHILKLWMCEVECSLIAMEIEVCLVSEDNFKSADLLANMYLNYGQKFHAWRDQWLWFLLLIVARQIEYKIIESETQFVYLSLKMTKCVACARSVDFPHELPLFLYLLNRLQSCVYLFVWSPERQRIECLRMYCS